MYGYIYLIVNNVNGKTYVGKRKLYNKNWYTNGTNNVCTSECPIGYKPGRVL